MSRSPFGEKATEYVETEQVEREDSFDDLLEEPKKEYLEIMTERGYFRGKRDQSEQCLSEANQTENME